MPNGMSERSVLIEHCGVGGSVRKDTLYPIQKPKRKDGTVKADVVLIVCNEVLAVLWQPREAVIITRL